MVVAALLAGWLAWQKGEIVEGTAAAAALVVVADEFKIRFDCEMAR